MATEKELIESQGMLTLEYRNALALEGIVLRLDELVQLVKEFKEWKNTN